MDVGREIRDGAQMMDYSRNAGGNRTEENPANSGPYWRRVETGAVKSQAHSRSNNRRGYGQLHRGGRWRRREQEKHELHRRYPPRAPQPQGLCGSPHPLPLCFDQNGKDVGEEMYGLVEWLCQKEGKKVD